MKAIWLDHLLGSPCFRCSHRASVNGSAVLASGPDRQTPPRLNESRSTPQALISDADGNRGQEHHAPLLLEAQSIEDRADDWVPLNSHESMEIARSGLAQQDLRQTADPGPSRFLFGRDEHRRERYRSAGMDHTRARTKQRRCH